MKVTMVPLFLTAKTPTQLTLAMLENNQRNGKHYVYFDIQKVGSQWYAWFNEDVIDYKVNKNVNK